MKSVDRLHVIQISGLQHPSGAAHRRQLLCRLEHQLYGTTDLVPPLKKELRRSQKPGHMVIMAAGVHDAVVSGFVLRLIHLLDLQSVHICPESHHAAFRSALDHADDAMASHMLDHLVTAHFL